MRMTWGGNKYNKPNSPPVLRSQLKEARVNAHWAGELFGMQASFEGVNICSQTWVERLLPAGKKHRADPADEAMTGAIRSGGR